MKELELCRSNIHKQRPANIWTLYNKSNHRCNNRKATYNQLKTALENWKNIEKHLPPHRCELYKIDINHENEKSYLKKALLKNESIENKKIICVIGEDWKKEYYITGTCCWNKIVFYDSNEKQYYLRHFAQTNIRGWDQKQLNESQTQGWYIDLSTLNAPAEFWDLLKKIILKKHWNVQIWLL